MLEEKIENKIQLKRGTKTTIKIIKTKLDIKIK